MEILAEACVNCLTVMRSQYSTKKTDNINLTDIAGHTQDTNIASIT